MPCSFLLDDGDLCGMLSDVSAPTAFQHCLVHRLPSLKRNPTKGWRLNLTFRVLDQAYTCVLAKLLKGSVQDTHVADGCVVRIWRDGEWGENIRELKPKLIQHVLDNSAADITKMFGNTYTNNGRRVMEISYNPEMKYTYAGKSVQCQRTPDFLDGTFSRIADMLGVSKDQMWVHVVYYPIHNCKMDWHADNESIVNPHAVMSLTLLEFPVEGARIFQIKPR